MKNEFIAAVQKQELAKVRMMLSNELLLDPRGVTFSEMLSYAKENIPNLFEPNTPSNYNIPADKVDWDDVLCSKVKRDLNSNFSVEKLALFQEIAMWLGKEKAAKIEDQENSHKKHYERVSVPRVTEDNDDSSTQTMKICGTVATIGGAVLTIYAIGAGKVLLSILGGGAIVVGGILLFSSKK